jgi:hypothetical protein
MAASARAAAPLVRLSRTDTERVGHEARRDVVVPVAGVAVLAAPTDASWVVPQREAQVLSRLGVLRISLGQHCCSGCARGNDGAKCDDGFVTVARRRRRPA